jgi:hypothetical protein
MYKLRLNPSTRLIFVFSLLISFITLPTSSALDTWTAVTGPGADPTETRQWVGIASSSDGSRLAASSFEAVWLSSNSGVTWTISNSADANYRGIASSSDGSKLLLASSNVTKLQRSTDSGATWSQLSNSVTQSWHKVASSADGQVLAAAGLHGTALYVSTNGGTSWSTKDVGNWNGIAISDNGATMVAVASSRAIYVSTDSGTTWNNRETARGWADVSISNDGTKMIASVGEGKIYRSIDSGTTWEILPNSPTKKHLSVACSSDCSTIVAGTNWEFVHYSSDSGASWYSSTTQIGWINDVALSDDGSKAFAAPYGQRFYLSAKAAPPAPTIGAVTATGASTATVSFTAPTTNGGSAITSYTAISNPGGITGSITQAESGTISVTGLSPSTTYTFTVKTTNSIGTSNASSASASITTNVAAPAFTLSSSSESKTVNTAISSYTITSTGGTIASYAISPAAPAGLTFNTTTGLLTGTPTSVAPATAYTITATNATSSTAQTFTLTVTAVPVVATNSAAEAAAQAEAVRRANEQRQMGDLSSVLPLINELIKEIEDGLKSTSAPKKKSSTSKTQQSSKAKPEKKSNSEPLTIPIPPASEPEAQNKVGEVVSLSHKVGFGLSASWINSSNIKALRGFIAGIEESLEVERIVIQGYAQPTKIGLSDIDIARAKAVKKLLIKDGLDYPIIVEGMGQAESKKGELSRLAVVTVEGKIKKQN